MATRKAAKGTSMGRKGTSRKAASKRPPAKGTSVKRSPTAKKVVAKRKPTTSKSAAPKKRPTARRTASGRPLSGGGQLRLLDVIELASNPLPLAALKVHAEDWVLIEDGDDTTGGYSEKEPHKCECGLSWNVNDKDADFPQRPTPQDIANLYAAIAYPKQATEHCDEPCVAVEQARYKRYRIFWNKTTGVFWLHCSKRVQWHCEKVELLATRVSNKA